MHNDADNHDLPYWEAFEIDPIACQLANGHSVKIAAGLWARWRTLEEWVSGVTPQPYFAIRVYCTEDTLPKRLEWTEEYCEGTDFNHRDFETIWEWLSRFCASREMFDFDSFQEFLHFLEDALLQFSTPDEDAVEHFKHLPGFSNPGAFDKVDDSISQTKTTPKNRPERRYD